MLRRGVHRGVLHDRWLDRRDLEGLALGRLENDLAGRNASGGRISGPIDHVGGHGDEGDDVALDREHHGRVILDLKGDALR
ncbi:MAG: hypothetical protein ACKOBP_02220, partial [Planctomycetia bacterium]